jgi:hypothetical protein
LLIGAEWLSAGLAGALLAALADASKSPSPNDRTLADLGNLLLAAVLFVAYLGFMQFLIVWEENLRAEIPWYLRRLSGMWTIVFLLSLGVKFLIPVPLLLIGRVKRSRKALAAIAGLILIGHLLTSWWLVLPAFPTNTPTWLLAAAVAAIGGLGLALPLERADG